MRDPRLGELEFLAHLERKGSFKITFHSQLQEQFGFPAHRFKDMVLQLLLDGHLNGPAECFWVNPALEGAQAWRDKAIAQDVIKVRSSGQPIVLSLSHKGYCHLGDLKGKLEAERRLDPSGLFMKDALRSDYAIAWAYLPEGGTIALLMCDLDRFKKVNDTLGHAMGDEAIALYHQVIKDHVEKFGSAYRSGGDEVVVLLAGLDRDRVQRLAEGIRAGVEATFKGMKELAPLDSRPTVTIGGVVLTQRIDWAAAVDAADKPLIATKEKNERNRVVWA